VSSRALFVLLIWPFAGVTPAGAQTSYTYHLHDEQTISYDGRDLRAEGPDRRSTVLATAVTPTMVGTTTTMRIFQLPPGEPALGTTMPAGSRVTFTLWMRINEDRGVVFPAAAATNMYPGGWSGSTGPYQSYCSTWSTSRLTTTLAPYTFYCDIPAAVAIDPTDRFTLWVAFATQSYTPAKGKRGGMSVELAIEGALFGATDSRLVLTTPP
jgi:hypothetical protein